MVNSVFLAWLHITAGGGTPATVGPFVAANLPAILKANWALWPAVNFATFKFIPQDYRILFCNAVGVCWVTCPPLSRSSRLLRLCCRPAS